MEDLSGKPSKILGAAQHIPVDRGGDATTSFPADPPPIGDLLAVEAERKAAGKKLCGMCGNKAAGKNVWICTLSPAFKCACPAPEGACISFLKKPSVIRHLQRKKKGLPVPAGVKYFYYGRPAAHSGPYLGHSPHDHQGVVTVAWIEPSPGLLHLAFSFCSPEDRWCKTKGRDMALGRLLRPIVVPFLYSPQRTVYEATRAILSHDFGRLAALSPGTTMWGAVPSWTKRLAGRLVAGEKRDRRIKRFAEYSLSKIILGGCPGITASQYPLGIMAKMMADIASLGNG